MIKAAHLSKNTCKAYFLPKIMKYMGILIFKSVSYKPYVLWMSMILDGLSKSFFPFFLEFAGFLTFGAFTTGSSFGKVCILISVFGVVVVGISTFFWKTKIKKYSLYA